MGSPTAPASAEIGQRSLLSAIFRVEVSGIVAVAILGSLHLSMMSALGIWLWSDPGSFGNPRHLESCAVELSSYIILGKRIPLSSNALRIVSLVIYAIFLAPGFNLLLPMAIFLGMLFIYRACYGPRHAPKFDSSSRRNVRIQDPTVKIGLSQSHSKGVVGRSLLALQGWYNPFLFPIFAGMALLFAINVAFLIDIELTLRDNRHLRKAGDSEWTFGQILAIILLVLPMRDLRVFGARRNFTSLLQNALRWHETTSTDILRDLVRRGANVNVKVEGSRYPTVLLLAVSDRRDAEFTRMLLVYGANPNMKDGTDRTALQAASSHADLQIIKLLLANGADPNIEGGDYGTALQAASHSRNLEIVQLLLDSGADVNIQGGKYGTALEAASASGYTEIVELLRAHGPLVLLLPLLVGETNDMPTSHNLISVLSLLYYCYL